MGWAIETAPDLGPPGQIGQAEMCVCRVEGVSRRSHGLIIHGLLHIYQQGCGGGELKECQLDHESH
jgi:hypothetical protein